MSKKGKFTYTIILLFFSTVVSAQSQYPLSGEGRTDMVKLFWLPQTWKEGDVGFKIKRREIKSNNQKEAWANLTESIIIPECSMVKDLSNVEPDAAQQARLKQRLEYYLSKRDEYIKLSEVTREEYLEFISEKGKIQSLSFLFYKDFDIAQLHGFGFIDRNIPKAHGWEYGLFIVNNNQQENLVNTYYWEYGTSEELKVAMATSYRIKKRKKQVQVTWEFNSEDYFSDKRIAGFNLYKKSGSSSHQKLNKTRLIVGRDKNNKSQLVYKDTISSDSNYTYAATPVSIFNSEGIYTEVVIQMIPKLESLAVSDFKLVGLKEEQTTKELSFEWAYNTLHEPATNGFYLCSYSTANKLDTLSELIPANDRSYIQKFQNIKDGELLNFTLLASLKNTADIYSSIFNHVYYNKPESPEFISAEPYELENGDIYIKLKWNKNHNNDKVILYQTRINFIDTVFLQAIDSALEVNEVDYYAGNSGDDSYGFTLQSINDRRDISPNSDTLFLVVPNYEYGKIFFRAPYISGSQVTLTWVFPQYQDLKGFRLFSNGDILLTEDQLVGESRTWQSDALQPGQYQFTIQAVSTYGVESPVSQKKTVVVRE